MSRAGFKYIRLHNETYKTSENGGAEGGEKRYYYGLYQIKLFTRKVYCGNIKNRFAAAEAYRGGGDEEGAGGQADRTFSLQKDC